MAQKESLLAARAAERRSRRNELQDLRLNNTEGYVRTLQESSVSKTMGASNRALSSSKPTEKKEREPSRLMQEMASMTAKLNKTSGDGKQKEKEAGARQAREKDISIKREDKQNASNQQNFKMMANVFKDQSERMIKAIRDLSKPKKVEEAAGEEITLSSLYEKYKEHKEKKKAEREEAEKKQQEESQPRRKKRSRRGRGRGRSASGGGSLGDSDLTLDDFGDSGSDSTDDEKKRKRNEKRNRRMDRVRNARGGRGGGRMGRIGGALNRARGFGSSVLSRGSSLASRGAGLVGSISNSGIGSALGTGAKVLGGLGAVGGAVDAAYSAAPHMGNLFDSNADTASRFSSGAHLLVQGAGAGIGGVLGGVQGASMGASIGGHVADGADWVGNQISGTGVGDVIGASVALALTPFSEDAREAVVSDFKNKILPGMESTFGGFGKTLGEKIFDFQKTMGEVGDKLGNLKDGAKNAIINIVQGGSKAIDAVVDGAKNAGNQIAEGYRKDGVVGGLKAVKGTAGLIGEGVGKGGAAIADGVRNAGSSMRYANDKGSKNALDLAMGFSANTGFKGMTDSQSKAYAGNVMKTESGGKLGITNQYGFAGQYQFGADALADNGLIDKDKLSAAKKAAKAEGKSWYDGGMHKKFMEDGSNWKNEGGREAFLNDKKLQDNTFVDYTNRNIEAGYRSGALTAKSTAADIAAYGKAAHLKGTGGANDYFLRGKDSADANGMRVSSYAKGASDSMNDLSAQVDGAKAGGKGAVPTQVAMAPSATKTTATKSDVKVAGAIATGSKAAETEAETLKSKISGEEKRTSNIASTGADTEMKSSPYDFVYQGPSPSQASAIPTATASAQTLPMLQGNVPPEMKTVMVGNQPAPAPAGGNTVVQGGGSKGGGAPTLDEMPMFINDMGLVLLQTGHV